MRIIVISAHPDDETLGCGATLLKHGANGDDLFWLIVTQAHEPQWPASVIARKATEVERVAEAYGMKEYFRLGFPTTQLDVTPEAGLIESIRERLAYVKPDIVYVVYGGDVHSDHRAVFSATTAVLKPIYMSSLGVRKLLCYETLSSTEAAAFPGFTPTAFNDVSPYLERKLQIMELYETEGQGDLMPRGSSAIRALARHRGATIGVEYAEAFSLVRELM
jgi:LmbE family N-acetylglucosaminyl deacetylase